MRSPTRSRWLALLSRPLNVFRLDQRPVHLRLNKASNAIVRLFGVDPSDLGEKHTSDDLKEIIQTSAKGGSLDPGEAVMLGGVFHLHEQEAREVMTPIPAVVTVNADETVEEALRRCVSSGHTRLVVVEDDNPDKVRGIVHNNSLVRLYLNAGPDASLEPAIREVPVFPETKPLDDLLAELQRQRSSIGIVSDEYGRTVGIVTVEDILEEVVGEIEDETDPRAVSCGGSPTATGTCAATSRSAISRTPGSSSRSPPTPSTRSAATSSPSSGGCRSAATRCSPTATSCGSNPCATTASSRSASTRSPPSTKVRRRDPAPKRPGGHRPRLPSAAPP